MTGIPLAHILALREAIEPYTRPISESDILDLARARRAFIDAQPDVTLTLRMIPDGDWLGRLPRPPRRDYRTLRRRRKLRYIMRRG